MCFNWFQDPNVVLIRELRAEVVRLKTMLAHHWVCIHVLLITYMLHIDQYSQAYPLFIKFWFPKSENELQILQTQNMEQLFWFKKYVLFFLLNPLWFNCNDDNLQDQNKELKNNETQVWLGTKSMIRWDQLACYFPARLFHNHCYGICKIR